MPNLQRTNCLFTPGTADPPEQEGTAICNYNLKQNIKDTRHAVVFHINRDLFIFVTKDNSCSAGYSDNNHDFNHTQM